MHVSADRSHPPRASPRCSRCWETGGQNDNYGFALAAHPGKSQGRPVAPAGSQPIAHTGLPDLRSPKAPDPEQPATLTRLADGTDRTLDRSFIPVHHETRLDFKRQRWVLDLHPIADSRAPSVCLCTGRDDVRRSGLPWVIAKRAPRRHRRRTPAFMRERGAECRKRIVSRHRRRLCCPTCR